MKKSAKKIAKHSPDKVEKFLNVTKFALLVGRTRQSVALDIKSGKIQSVSRDGRKVYIEVAKALEELKQNKTNPKKEIRQKIKELAKLEKEPGPSAAPYTIQKTDADGDITTAEAERRKKVYEAQLAELKFQEQSRQLVRADQVAKEAFEAGRQVRDAVLALPSRLAPELAVETDPHKLENMLTKEINFLLAKVINEAQK